MYISFAFRNLCSAILLKGHALEIFDKTSKGIREGPQIFTLKLCDLVY